MRDILITVVVLGLLPFILRSPRIGAYVWTWLSMMNPHRAAFGFARNLPFAYLVALSTLVGFLFSRDRRPFPVNSITVTQVLLLVWMSITCLFALNSTEVVLDRWIFVLKIQLMLFMTLMLIRGREQIERLIWVVTLSIGFYGVKGGIWTLMGGGSGRVWGPAGSMIEGNNEIGLALVMLVPFMYFLHQVSTRRLIRAALVFAIVTSCFAILGSQSRGALLALVSMAFLLALKGKRPIQMSLLLGTLLVSAILFMPESWTGRMETIKSYEADSSAMSRIYTWKTLWNLALDRPLVGGGFASDNAAVFAAYAPERVGDYMGGAVLVAHSIYFQALGEHGFPGLLLYLLLGLFTWRKAAEIAKKTEKDAELATWVPLLMRMVQVSLVGFAIGGAFLSLVYFDLPYYIVGYVVLVDATLREREKSNPIAQLSEKKTTIISKPFMANSK
jgi:probable O-glycosylation ligase (exosortase A-associated)